jgi:hypothetical protein
MRANPNRRARRISSSWDGRRSTWKHEQFKQQENKQQEKRAYGKTLSKAAKDVSKRKGRK